MMTDQVSRVPSATFLRPGESKTSAFGVSFLKSTPARGDLDEDPSLLFDRQSLLRVRDRQHRLPIYSYKRDILYLVERHATCVIVGETGSGKTTQVPQYLFQAGWAPRGSTIACTQPRRIAAMTIASRVAKEMNVALGKEVGYASRFEDISDPEETRIKFCTDGILLKEMASDPLLTQYSVIMVDEAHERSTVTDVLLGLLKKVQKKRPGLRVIISSATIQAETFAAFFNDESKNVDPSKASVESPSGVPGILSVEGRPHRVHVSYLQKPCHDYVLTAVNTVIDINSSDVPGDILVFFTGQEECEKAVDLILEYNHSRKQNGSYKLVPVALYSGLPSKYQTQVFDSMPRNHRKVVFSTNIAETSVTIEGIVHVVDCMFAKQRTYDPYTGLESIMIGPISKASAIQRSGRAGRVRTGFSYRLCTEAAFETLEEVDMPELQRSDLTSILLQLKGLGIDNILNFSWLAPPLAESMVRALENLHALGAMDDEACLTHNLGAYMSELALDPQLSRSLLLSWSFGCVYEVATIISVLNVQNIWASGGRKAVNEAKSQFAVAEGDLITYLNVWKAWESNKRNKSWAYKNYISHSSLLRAAEIRDRLLRQIIFMKKHSAHDDAIFSCGALDRIKDNIILRNDLSGDQIKDRLVNIRKSLAGGLFLNSVQMRHGSVGQPEVDASGQPLYKLLRNTGDPASDESRLRIHPSSVLFGSTKHEWLCFYSAQHVGKHAIDMQEVLIIEPEWLVEAAPNYFISSKNKSI